MISRQNYESGIYTKLTIEIDLYTYLKSRKKNLINFVTLFTKIDKNKYGIINYEDFKNLFQNME